MEHILENFFPDKRNGIVVECGTSQGDSPLLKDLYNRLDWEIIGFEIDPRYWPLLLQNRPYGLNINLGLSDKNEFVDFIVTTWGGNSSLDLSEDHKKELISFNKTFPNGTFFEKIKISTITWKTFIKQYKITHVDYFILDVEGCEIKVLNGMVGSEVMPDVIQVEYAYSDPSEKLKNNESNENFSGFVIIKHKLEEMGYIFNYVHFNDAFFSKKEFWKDKIMPDIWIGEDEKFIYPYYKKYCFYDKEKCKNL